VNDIYQPTVSANTTQLAKIYTTVVNKWRPEWFCKNYGSDLELQYMYVSV